ncbi:MAG TPA: hypothetical protein VH583_25820 [Vicinamibacterales bacterium]
MRAPTIVGHGAVTMLSGKDPAEVDDGRRAERVDLRRRPAKLGDQRDDEHQSDAGEV